MFKGRSERRIRTNATACLQDADEPLRREKVVLVGISLHGARVIGSGHWSRGKKVILSDSHVNIAVDAEVVYCEQQAPSHFAVGVMFTQGSRFFAEFGGLGADFPGSGAGTRIGA